MMVLEEDPANYWKFPSATVEAIPFDNGTAKFEMLLALMTTAQGIRGAWEYRSDLFSADRIERMCEQWQQLLAAIVSDPTEEDCGARMVVECRPSISSILIATLPP